VAQIVDKLAATDQFTKAEVTKALKSKDLVVPLRPKGETSLEGLLFPDTYGIEEDDTAVAVIQDMLDQLEAVLSRYQLSTAPQGRNAYELLIVASMIEREAKVPADRPKIAAVIYNRLAIGKRLEIDATVQYAVGHAKLTAKDLQSSSPYNTYTSDGLPPTRSPPPARPPSRPPSSRPTATGSTTCSPPRTARTPSPGATRSSSASRPRPRPALAVPVAALLGWPLSPTRCCGGWSSRSSLRAPITGPGASS
jgi:YceG-like family